MQRDDAVTVVQVPAGPIETNAYLVIDPETREALVVDAPPASADAIEAEVRSRAVRPVALVVTHTHWDHIGDVAELQRRLGVPVLIHRLEAERLANPRGGPAPIPPAAADRQLDAGDEVVVGSRAFQVLHTPGHSPGQISLYAARDAILLGGDTLFPGGYGRVDLPGASEAETLRTLAQLLELPDEVVVLPGHGAPTTIGRERPWMERCVATGRLL